MDLLQLRAFVSVAEHASFSLAAEQLHLTQPAVSKRLRALESDLGTSLLDRVGRRVQLTEAGATLLPRARQLLASAADMEVEIRNLTGSVSGVLQLATSHHIGLHRLPPLLRTFNQRYPEVHLDIHFVDSEEAADLLLGGAAELAVVTLNPAGYERLRAQPLWADPLVFLAAADHVLAGGRPVSLADLSRHTAILPDMATFTGRIVAALFQRAGLPLTSSLATNYLETVRMMAAVGLGWTVLPATMQDERLVQLRVEPADPIARTLGYLVNPGRAQSNAAMAFLQLLESEREV